MVELLITALSLVESLIALKYFQVVILAAGYGTRLSADLEKSPGEKWQRLAGVPKPLLPLGGVPLISRWRSGALSLVKILILGSHWLDYDVAIVSSLMP